MPAAERERIPVAWQSKTSDRMLWPRHDGGTNRRCVSSLDSHHVVWALAAMPGMASTVSTRELMWGGVPHGDGRGPENLITTPRWRNPELWQVPLPSTALLLASRRRLCRREPSPCIESCHCPVRAPRKTHRYRHSGKVRPGPCSPQCFLLNLYRFEADSSVVSTPTSGEARTISYVPLKSFMMRP